MEYYDFALYSLASALVLGPLFFPNANPAIGQILSFATYFVGFLVRPIGGIVFGHPGEKPGRKFVLVVTILMMGGASTLIGLLPTYSSQPATGPAEQACRAPILLVVLRISRQPPAPSPRAEVS